MSLAPVAGLTGVLEAQRAQLRRFLAARTANEDDADDILSDLWMKASLIELGSISNPVSYLYRMANNLVLDRLREANRRIRRDSDWVADQIGAQFLQTEPCGPHGRR